MKHHRIKNVCLVEHKKFVKQFASITRERGDKSFEFVVACGGTLYVSDKMYVELPSAFDMTDKKVF